MSESIKSWFISGGSLIAGMACVIVIWSNIPQEDQTIAQNKVRFSELSSREQADLRNKAKLFVDTTNESELTRLQQIHDAVASDEKLLTRLKSLDCLLGNVDAETKAKLNPNGEFADDWAQQVETLALDENAGDVTYEFAFDRLRESRFRRPPIVVNGYEYEAFLDAASAQDWGQNQEYQKFLKGNDRTTRRMFKTLALVERSMQDESNQLNASIATLAKEMLVPEDSLQEDRNRPPEYGSERKGDRREEEEREKARAQIRVLFTNLIALEVLEEGLNKIRDEFLRRVARETVAPEVFTQQFKRSEQLELMTMAPDAANQELTARLVRDNHVQGSETARINEILEQAKKQISERSNDLKGQIRETGYKYFGGSWRGRGGDGRGGDGRGSRGPDDRGNGERGPNGRGPGGRGQGGPAGPPFDDNRGPNGQPGRGPDSRPQDGRERQGQRPPLDRGEAESGKK